MAPFFWPFFLLHCSGCDWTDFLVASITHRKQVLSAPASTWAQIAAGLSGPVGPIYPHRLSEWDHSGGSFSSLALLFHQSQHISLSSMLLTTLSLQVPMIWSVFHSPSIFPGSLTLQTSSHFSWLLTYKTYLARFSILPPLRPTALGVLIFRLQWWQWVKESDTGNAVRFRSTEK